jgi:hypothetical protein
MTVTAVRRMRELEEENRRLKRLVEDQAMDILALVFASTNGYDRRKA